MRSHFSISQPKALRSRARDYLSELRRATCTEESHLSYAHPSPLLNFLPLPLIFPRLLPLAQTKLPIPCSNTFLALARIFIFTSSISPELCIPFLSFGRHLLLFPFTRWECLSTLMLPSGLSLSTPASQSCLNASFYPVYFLSGV